MSLPEWIVTLSTGARQQADEIQVWWETERPAAPWLFRDELAAACRRLAHAPRSGMEILDATGCRRRRLLLRRSGYHVYYRVDEAHCCVTIHAIWHASRGRGPWFVRERSPVMAWRGGTRGEIRSRFLRVLQRRDALPM